MPACNSRAFPLGFPWAVLVSALVATRGWSRTLVAWRQRGLQQQMAEFTTEQRRADLDASLISEYRSAAVLVHYRSRGYQAESSCQHTGCHLV